MKNERWVAGSRRLYARLIKLYPKEHVAEYGEAMRQVFTDQCREISREKGIPGLVLLWLRTMVDLGKTAVSEHMHARQAAMRLPEIAPLPWKDAWLVLIPGSVWLIVYTVLLVWNDAHVYEMLFLSILLSAIPILWIWWRSKEFPVWGLIPAGMILYEAFETIYNVPFRWSGFHAGSWLLLTAIFFVLIVSLGWRYARLWHPSGKVAIWLGICLFANLAQIALMVFYSPQASHWSWTAVLSESMKNSFPSMWFVVEETIGLLLFVVCTTMFIKKQGNLSVLFLLGYFFTNYLSFRVPLATAGNVYSLVLVYRLFLTILLPLWVVRASSARSRSRGVTIPAILAFLALAVLSGGIYAGWLLKDMPSKDSALLIAWSVFRTASFIAGFILAEQLSRTAGLSMKDSLRPMEIPPETAQA